MRYTALTAIDYGLEDWKYYDNGVISTDEPMDVSLTFALPQLLPWGAHLKKGQTAAGYVVFVVPAKGEIRVAYGRDLFEFVVRGKPAATVTPRPSATAPAPVASPTPNSLAATTNHIGDSVRKLTTLGGDEALWSWMRDEAAWLLVNPGDVSLADYRATVAGGLASIADGSDVAAWASKVVTAADSLPRVSVPAIASTPSQTVYKPGQTVTVTVKGLPQAKITVSKVKWVKGYPTCCGDWFRPAPGHVYLQVLITFRAMTDIDYGLFDWLLYVNGKISKIRA